MKIQKSTINHVLAMLLFLLGLAAAIYGTSIMLKLVVPYAYDQTRYLSQAFVGIAWIISWVLRGAYKSSRDLAFSDMGPITLKIYIAEMIQVYENKYGELTQADLEEVRRLKVVKEK